MQCIVCLKQIVGNGHAVKHRTTTVMLSVIDWLANTYVTCLKPTGPHGTAESESVVKFVVEPDYVSA